MSLRTLTVWSMFGARFINTDFDWRVGAVCRSLSRTARALVVCACAISCSVVCARPQDVSPPVKELVAELNRYEQAFHGLAFDVVWPALERREFVSRDGRIRSWEGVTHLSGKPGGLPARTHQFAGKACADQGWVFSISYVSKPSPDEARMTVKFFPPKTSGALSAVNVLHGFRANMTFAEFAIQCDCSTREDVFFGSSVLALQCDHPQCGTTVFFFDQHSLQLVGFRDRLVGGNQRDLGSLYVPPIIIPEGQWVESTYGPIRYMVFEGRRVPDTIPVSGNSSEPNSRSEGIARFQNYARLDRDLTPRIEFDTVKLPDDGERVTSQGEEGIRYELRGGEVVKIIDADARRSAAQAKFHRSGQSRTVWYLAGAALAAGILGFLAYRWTRRE